MENKILTVHIGYPKTATTTFQKHLFAANGKIYYPGKYPPSYNPKNQISKDFAKILHEKKESEFKRAVADLSVLSALQNSRYKYGLLSEEAIIDKCFTPISKNKVLQDLNDLMRKIYLLRENRKVKIRILVTLRRQEELIPSFYAQKYEQFTKAGYPNLTQYIKVLTGSSGGEIGAQAIDFFNLFTLLKRIMPSEDIGIVSIHGLQACEKSALEIFSDFTGNKVESIIAAVKHHENKRLKKKNTWVSRNTKIISLFAGIGSAIPISVFKRRQIRQLMESCFNLTNGREILFTDDDYHNIQNKYRASNEYLEAELQRALF